MRYRGEVLDSGRLFATVIGGDPFPPLVTMIIETGNGTSVNFSMDARQARELSRHLQEAAVSIGPQLVVEK